MADSSVIISEDELNRLVTGFVRGVSDLSPIMPEIGEILIFSVEQNFLEGGRYSDGPGGTFEGGTQKWKPTKSSQGSTETTRDRKGRFKKTGGRILQDTGLLAASINVQTMSDSIILTSPMAYAAIHQYGGQINHPGGTPYIVTEEGAQFLRKDGEYPPGVQFTRPHVIIMPARPYLVIQDEDIEDIGKAIARHALTS